MPEATNAAMKSHAVTSYVAREELPRERASPPARLVVKATARCKPSVPPHLRVKSPRSRARDVAINRL